MERRTTTDRDADRIDRLRLIRSRRVGPATYHRLLAEHASPRAALSALPDIAAAAGMGRYQPYAHGRAADEYWHGLASGFDLICHGDPGYPALLAETEAAPPVLWSAGDPACLARPAVAIVGARNASALGRRFTQKLAAELSEAGIVIVSGLARGIDAAAHRAALPGGTIGVQAGGLDVIYPRENATLHDDLAKTGLRLSEQPLGLVPQARHFPQRNRIIAGLALATLVVEGASRSGSLITAREAADMGREVMAVPGSPLDQRAGGCNMLIREGATLIRSAGDVLAALPAPPAPAPVQHPPARPPGPPSPPPVPPGQRPGIPAPSGQRPGIPAPSGQRPEIPAPSDQRPEIQPSPGQGPDSRILSLLGPSAIAEDALIRDIGLPAAEVVPHLTRLELEGRITRQPGGMLSLAL